MACDFGILTLFNERGETRSETRQHQDRVAGLGGILQEAIQIAIGGGLVNQLTPPDRPISRLFGAKHDLWYSCARVPKGACAAECRIFVECYRQGWNPFPEISLMFSRLLLLFALVPLLELWLLTELAERTSWLTTIAVVLSTGVIGISLVRWQGITTWKEIQRQLASGQSPTRTIVSGVLILVAGALLLTPGLLTDTAGFLLLIPVVRRTAVTFLQKTFASSVSTKFRSSVWVSSASFGSDFRKDSPIHESERPHVEVIEPNYPRIDTQ